MSDHGNDDENMQERIAKPDRVSKKRLEELGTSNAFIGIFHRNKSTGAFDPIYSPYPKDAAMCFSTTINEGLRGGMKFYEIPKDDDVAPYKFLFNWFKECRETHDDRNLPEIPVENEEDPFTPYINILSTAQKLGVPDLTFGAQLRKKLLVLARGALISLDWVRKIYDNCHEVSKLGLQEIAATSIFEAWYTYKLEEDEHIDFMCDLSDMRENMPELDQDLHQAVTNKDEFLKERRRKKQADNDAAMATNDNFGSNGDFGASDNFDNGWAQQNDGDNPGVTSEWSTEDNTGAPTPAWMEDEDQNTDREFMIWNADKGDNSALRGDTATSPAKARGSWADEVEDEPDFAAQAHNVTDSGGW